MPKNSFGVKKPARRVLVICCLIATTLAISSFGGFQIPITMMMNVSAIASTGSINPVSSIHTSSSVYVLDYDSVSVVSGKKLIQTINFTAQYPGNQAAYDPVNNMIYVPTCGKNCENGTVSIINAATNRLVKVILGIGSGGGALWVPYNNFVYVSDWTGRTVFVINATTNKIVDNISVGDAPVWMGYDPITNTVWVGNDFGSSVSVISAKTNTVIKTLTSGLVSPNGIAYDPANKLMYVVDSFYNYYGAVFVFNSSSNYKLVKIITSSKDFNFLWDIAYNPLNKEMYLTSLQSGSHGTGTVIILNGTRIVKVIQMPDNSNPGGVAFNPSNGLMYVANGGINTLSMINGTKLLNKQISLTPGYPPSGLVVS